MVRTVNATSRPFIPRSGATRGIRASWLLRAALALPGGMAGAAALTTPAILMAPTTLTAQQDDALERGRTLTILFLEGNTGEVAVTLTPQMSTAIGGAEGLAAFHAQVSGQLGAEVEVLGEEVSEEAGHQVYRRTSRFSGVEVPVVFTWAFAPDGGVAGFSIQPRDAPSEAPSPHLDYETRTPLRLPFEGEWTVFWGGRSTAENYHAAYPDQRFAYDLVVVRDGSTHSGEGSRNEDYHCFGLPILAPGDGIVITARGDLPDNVPGEMESPVPPGNHVVLDHGNGEFTFLAHLQQGSLEVRSGDPVSAGERVGRCGNSGRSSEPHLHLHMQTTPDFGRGEGLPAFFRDYLADDLPVERGEPVRGQRVRPAGSDPQNTR